MKIVYYKDLEESGTEQTAPLDNFLLQLPYFFSEGYIPPLSIINLVLAEGYYDVGMSDGAKWEPFVINDTEYQELLEVLEDKTRCNGDKFNFSLTQIVIENQNQWHAKVYENEFGMPYQRHLELMEKCDNYQQKCRTAYENGNEQDGAKWHLKSIHCGQELVEFIEKYMHQK